MCMGDLCASAHVFGSDWGNQHVLEQKQSVQNASFMADTP